jgi:serine/threonine protein kinase
MSYQVAFSWDYDRLHASYKIGTSIGRGGFGEVFCGTRIKDNLSVAIKFVNKQKVVGWSLVRVVQE